MFDRPLVSIMVPVYNSAEHLSRFLESALTQTLENIEIICINNQSTDNSKEILETYQNLYPQKLFIYDTDEHYNTAAYGRNIALKYARGEYAFMCDSDDIIAPYGIERLYNEAVKFNCDLVCGWAKIAYEDEKGQLTLRDMNKKQTQLVNNETAILSGCEYWQRLIKISLLKQVGRIPENFVFDDVAYVTVLQSQAKKIRFVNEVVYFYFRRTDSLSGSLNYMTCATSIMAEKYALRNCNPKYIDAVQKLVAQRTKLNLETRWPFFDMFVEWAKEQMVWAPQNNLLLADPKIYSKLRWAASLTENTIPQRIFIGAFERVPSDDRIKELEEKVFYEGCQLRTLSHENCDLETNAYVKSAYEKGEYALVDAYYALKGIYEEGGIFIHDRIRILNYFSYYRYQNAFFCLIDKDTYSDSIYGSPAGNPVIEDLLATFSFEWDKKKKYSSLAERIKVILTAKYEVPLDGKEKLFQYPVSIISPELCVADTRFGSLTRRTVCEHDFSAYALSDDYITIKRSTLETIISNERNSGGALVAGTQPVRGTANSVVSQMKTHREKKLEEELNDIKQSNLWKLMQKLKKIGDGPRGPFLKKIFHKVIKA